jgi:hypothetical protein
MKPSITDDLGVLPAVQSLTIRDIQSIHEALLAALTKNDSLELSFDDEAPVDLSFVQLIESARLYTAHQNKTVRLARPAGPNIRRILERGGFLAAQAPEVARFWLHEEVAS